MAVITTINNDASLSKGATPTSDITSNHRSTSIQSSINTSATVEGAIEKGQDEWVMETTLDRNKKLGNLYNSIRAPGVLVGVSRSKGFVHFNVTTEDHTTKRLFSIYQGKGEILIVDENGEPIDRLTKKDKEHEQWKQAFEKACKLEPNTMYTGEKFLHSIIPTLGKVLNPRIDNKHEQKGQGRWADAFLPNGEFINKYFPGWNNTATTTPSIEITSNESTKTMLNGHPIADGAIRRGNGTGTWESGLVNVTTKENRPVFNETIEEPTAIPAISKGTILGGTVFLALTGLTGGALGAVVLGLTTKMFYNYYYKTGRYNLRVAEEPNSCELQEIRSLPSQEQAVLEAKQPLLSQSCAEEVSAANIEEIVEEVLSATICIAEDSINHGTEAIKGHQRPYPENVQAIQDIIEKAQKNVEFLNACKGQDSNITSSDPTTKEDPMLSTVNEDNQRIIALVRKLREKLEAEKIQNSIQEDLRTKISTAEASIKCGTEAITKYHKLYPENAQAIQERIEKLKESMELLRPHVKKEDPNSTTSDLPRKKNLSSEEEVAINQALHTVPKNAKRIDNLVQELTKKHEQPQAQAESVVHLPPVDSTAGKAVSKLVAISEGEEGKSLLNDADNDTQGVEQTTPKVVGVLRRTPANISKLNKPSNTSNLHKQIIRQIDSNIVALSTSMKSASSESLATPSCKESQAQAGNLSSVSGLSHSCSNIDSNPIHEPSSADPNSSPSRSLTDLRAGSSTTQKNGYRESKLI